MKKSELRKVIREVISEHQGPLTEQTYIGDMSTMCAEGPNCQSPIYETSVNFSGGGNGVYVNRLMCPSGFVFQGPPIGYTSIAIIPYCVPNIGNPGDSNMAGHGSPDDPFVPGIGFEDQFIDQITGPGGPFGGGKDGGKGKPIRESKKRRK